MAASDRSNEQMSRRVVRELFGGGLYQQGRGFYVALELFAILKGAYRVDESVLPSGERIPSYWRESHETARSFAAFSPDRMNISDDHIDYSSRRPLEKLFSSVVLQIPGRRKQPEWTSVHLYPYIAELIHYDTVTRNRKAKIERYTYRGGGGLAHEILRNDPNSERLHETRLGLFPLIADSGTPLGRLANALKGFDQAREKEPFRGDSDTLIDVVTTSSRWMEIVRAGVNNIVKRDGVPSSRKVGHLMHWIPYCVARHQEQIAWSVLNGPNSLPPATPVDFGDSASAIRAISRANLDAARWSIYNALRHYVESRVDETEGIEKEKLETLLRGSRSWCESPRAFYTETLAAVGALNATTGKRHHTLTQPLLDSLVNALLPPKAEIELGAFMELIYEKMGLIIDQNAAGDAGLASTVDLSEFRSNSERFVQLLKLLGLVSEYSDATRMVHAEVGL